MRWRKGGRIFVPDGRWFWSQSHAQLPTVDVIEGGRLRIYYGTRDAQNRTRPSFIEVDAEEPRRVVYMHDRPVLDLGELGSFDDSGVMPSSIVEWDGRKYLYYIGWNVSTTVPYRLAIGVAVSEDGGIRFQRVFEGPIVDRSAVEPYFSTAPWVLRLGRQWRMWYVSTVRWVVHSGRPEPYYHIRCAESADGLQWHRSGVVAIELAAGEGGLGRPSVLASDHGYRMWYCVRAGWGYREDKARSYRIGYAESSNGTDWERKDHLAGIDVSSDGWDSEMIAYPCVVRVGGRTLMFYNGNGFGRSGIGYAELVDNETANDRRLYSGADHVPEQDRDGAGRERHEGRLE